MSEQEFRDWYMKRKSIVSLQSLLKGTGVPYTSFRRWLMGESGGKYPSGDALLTLRKHCELLGMKKKVEKDLQL